MEGPILATGSFSLVAKRCEVRRSELTRDGLAENLKSGFYFSSLRHKIGCCHVLRCQHISPASSLQPMLIFYFLVPKCAFTDHLFVEKLHKIYKIWRT